MTVAELIEKLKKEDPAALVVVTDDFGQSWQIKYIERSHAKTNACNAIVDIYNEPQAGKTVPAVEIH